MSGLPTVLSISCTSCGAKPGGHCVTKNSGTPTTYPHSARTKQFRRRMIKGARFIALIRRDIPELQLKKGDTCMVQPVWSRPNTVNIVHKMPHGKPLHDVQPATAVRFVEWEF